MQRASIITRHRHRLVRPVCPQLLALRFKSGVRTAKRVHAIVDGNTLSKAGGDILGDLTGNLAIAVVKPASPNTWSLWQALNPFRIIQAGPELFALVTVRAEEADMGDFTGVEDADMQEQIVQACSGQSRLKYKGILSFISVEHSQGQRGQKNQAKLVPGAVVAANLDLASDPSRMGLIAGATATAGVANVCQGYGKVLTVHTDPNGEVQSADVAFEGQWSNDWSQAIHLYHTTESGFVAHVSVDRLIAHASFRNILVTTTLDYLQWEIALLWPEMLALEEIVFVDTQIGCALTTKVPKRIRDLLEGHVRVEIRGRPVRILDPTLAMKPQALNLTISGLFAVGLASFISGIACLASPGAWLLCPIGVVPMLAALVVECSWSRVAVQERKKFAKELEGGPLNERQDKLDR